MIRSELSTKTLVGQNEVSLLPEVGTLRRLFVSATRLDSILIVFRICHSDLKCKDGIGFCSLSRAHILSRSGRQQQRVY
jgi:hypothetical protein